MGGEMSVATIERGGEASEGMHVNGACVCVVCLYVLSLCAIFCQMD